MHITKELHDYERRASHSFEHMLRSAILGAGFNLVQRPADTQITAKLDICVTVGVEGVATSRVDATREVFIGDISPGIMEKLGKTICLLSCDRIESVTPTSPAAPTQWIFRDVLLCRAFSQSEEVQTTYLAMQGIYPDLPPLSQLTDAQKQTISTHISMLADYLRK